MSLPTAEELDIYEHLLRRIARERQKAVRGGPSGPYLVLVSVEVAKAIESAVERRHLFPMETEERPDLAEGERWVCFLDGVHVVEARR